MPINSGEPGGRHAFVPLGIINYDWRFFEGQVSEVFSDRLHVPAMGEPTIKSPAKKDFWLFDRWTLDCRRVTTWTFEHDSTYLEIICLRMEEHMLEIGSLGDFLISIT